MNRYRRRSPVALVAAAALMATAACGSTVQTSGDTVLGGGQQVPGAVEQGLAPAEDGLGGAAPDGLAPDGLGTDAGAGSFGGSGGGTTTSSGAGGTTTSSGGGGSTTSSGGGGGTAVQQPGSTGGATSTAVGPGVTDKTIALGLPYCNDCASGNAALGAGGEDPGDTRRYYQAALDDVNSRGGVLGRTFVPVFHEVSVSDNIDASAQEACETFTKDNKVLYMAAVRGEISFDCGQKAGVLVNGAGGIGPVYDKYPNVFAPASIRLERLFDVTVKSMVRAGWQKPEPKWPTGKIGLITWDNNDYRFAMKNGYLKAMAETGLKDEIVRYIAVPQNPNAIADASAAISNAVLAFRQAGVDHVFIGDGPAGIFTGVGLTLLFLQNSQSQNYFPRYGFNSNNAPDFDSHPQEQLVGMLAVDSFDTEAANDEGIALNPVRERCFAVMKKKGLPVGQAQTQTLAANVCDLVWFAEAVLKRATAGTTLPNLIAAAESLGTSYRSPLSYGNRIQRGQHDGVALFRALRFDQACSCIKYTSKPFEP